eukprot:Tamp_15901.p1 GENE.Tamp_15901~~Tamp_15901.p1  ORF type:complete len:267 (-),score=33.53 Tamp_15901:707-1471(-)
MAGAPVIEYRGPCTKCQQDVTTEHLRGKDVDSGGYFHIECPPLLQPALQPVRWEPVVEAPRTMGRDASFLPAQQDPTPPIYEQKKFESARVVHVSRETAPVIYSAPVASSSWRPSSVHQDSLGNAPPQYVKLPPTNVSRMPAEDDPLPRDGPREPDEARSEADSWFTVPKWLSDSFQWDQHGQNETVPLFGFLDASMCWLGDPRDPEKTLARREARGSRVLDSISKPDPYYHGSRLPEKDYRRYETSVVSPDIC